MWTQLDATRADTAKDQRSSSCPGKPPHPCASSGAMRDHYSDRCVRDVVSPSGSLTGAETTHYEHSKRDSERPPGTVRDDENSTHGGAPRAGPVARRPGAKTGAIRPPFSR